MNNKLTKYTVTIESYKFTSYIDMYKTMAKHWEYCGGTIMMVMNQYYKYSPPIWQGNDYTLTQFKLTQPDDNIIITFTKLNENHDDNHYG